LTSESTKNVLLRKCEETGGPIQQLFVEVAGGLKNVSVCLLQINKNI
jgi:hypothetical protein